MANSLDFLTRGVGRAAFGFFILVFVMSVSCSGQKKQAPAPKTYESETVEEAEAAPTPASSQGREIDLGIEGEYGQVEIEEGDEAPPEYQPPPEDGKDYSCETAVECQDRGLPRKKQPGEWFCVQNTCVMKYEAPSLDPL